MTACGDDDVGGLIFGGGIDVLVDGFRFSFELVGDSGVKVGIVSPNGCRF